MKNLCSCFAVAAAASLCLWSATRAADEAVKATPVATGINNPTGLAVHSGGDVFIAATSGVHRLSGGKLSDEVTGFGTDIYGKGPKYNIGPLGVALLDDKNLIVADGSNTDDKEVVLQFKVDAKPGKAQKPADAVATVGPIKPGAESAKGEGNYYGVTVAGGAAFITCNGDDTKGWIAKSMIADGKLVDLKPYIATKVKTNVDAPVGITTSLDGKHLVVGQMGEINVAGDSLLTMYDLSGEMTKNYKTGLNDIAGLAFSPKTKKLYAVDFSWVDTTKGGLFRIDVEGDAVKTTKILSLDKPTALAFGKDGTLYISVLGAVKEGGEPAGEVLKVDAGL